MNENEYYPEFYKHYCSRKECLNLDKFNNNKGTPTKRTGSKDKINLDYDFNTEYGDGDVPDIDKPNNEDDDDNYSDEY